MDLDDNVGVTSGMSTSPPMLTPLGEQIKMSGTPPGSPNIGAASPATGAPSLGVCAPSPPVAVPSSVSGVLSPAVAATSPVVGYVAFLTCLCLMS